MPVFKMDYAHKEAEERFGYEPRAYGAQTMRYDVDRIGNVRGVYTQTLRKMPDGSTKIDDTEKHWPADLILLAIDLQALKIPCRIRSTYAQSETKL